MAHVYARPHHMLQTEEEVLDIVEDDPSTSTREIARQAPPYAANRKRGFWILLRMILQRVLEKLHVR
ncbi:hypothetical protein NQ317_010391 [Molorchus minor]|uniref:Uncharacterized protein n=1 Tax=Molorchus minor TaxID=1323400 RepID=A0ABQ9JB05_9CUCU|nr:hypothetical protein NQ317_010391 [Molorchus minor]